MLLPNFLEQLVYSVMPEIRSTLVYITCMNSYKTVPVLSKQKEPSTTFFSCAVQLLRKHSCEEPMQMQTGFLKPPGPVLPVLLTSARSLLRDSK